VNIALVHDYLTQRGGAERVVLSMTRAFPEAPIYTSLYEPSRTFPEFLNARVVPTALNHVAPLRHHHRLALPLLATTFDRLRVDADVALCSSSGWAHGASVTGRKVVYCHTPARWLYQTSTYLGRGRSAALAPVRPLLRSWDRRAAATADRYLVNSRAVQQRVWDAYGVDSDVVPPPPSLHPAGPMAPPPGVTDGGFLLCVSRLIRYKNVGAVVAAFRYLPDLELVVAGTGREERSLRAHAPPNVRFVGTVDDEQLRWLYAHAQGVVSASREDFGLTPLEAAGFGVPSAVLRWGGFLDTVVEGETGYFFEEPHAPLIASTVRRLVVNRPPAARLLEKADEFSEETFIRRITDVARSVAVP
jgi:glycosyltransferase involved in cell wall biosynthesis